MREEARTCASRQKPVQLLRIASRLFCRLCAKKPQGAGKLSLSRLYSRGEIRCASSGEKSRSQAASVVLCYKDRQGRILRRAGKSVFGITTFVSRPYRLTTQTTRKTRPGRGRLHEIVSPFMSASREAYDLHNPACRANAWARLKRGDWKRLWFLKLIVTDTWNNVCPPRKG